MAFRSLRLRLSLTCSRVPSCHADTWQPRSALEQPSTSVPATCAAPGLLMRWPRPRRNTPMRIITQRIRIQGMRAVVLRSRNPPPTPVAYFPVRAGQALRVILLILSLLPLPACYPAQRRPNYYPSHRPGCVPRRAPRPPDSPAGKRWSYHSTNSLPREDRGSVVRAHARIEGELYATPDYRLLPAG